MIQGAKLCQKEPCIYCKILTLGGFKLIIVGFVKQDQEIKINNFKCYNLSIYVDKVFKFFSKHSHGNLVQICMVEFGKKIIFFIALKSGTFHKLCPKCASFL